MSKANWGLWAISSLVFVMSGVVLCQIVLAAFSFYVVLELGLAQGFDPVLGVMMLVFGILAGGELITWIFYGPQDGDFLGSTGANVALVLLRLLWLGVAIVLLFFSYSGEPAASDAFLVSLLLFGGNTPLFVFHLALCSQKFRKGLLQFQAEKHRRSKESQAG